MFRYILTESISWDVEQERHVRDCPSPNPISFEMKPDFYSYIFQRGHWKKIPAHMQKCTADYTEVLLIIDSKTKEFCNANC